MKPNQAVLDNINQIKTSGPNKGFYCNAQNSQVLRHVDWEKIDYSMEKKRIKLCLAAMSGDTELLIQAINNIPYIDYPDPWGNTALMFAVMSQSIEEVQILLRHGADPDRQSLSGRTARKLALGAFEEDQDMLRLFTNIPQSGTQNARIIKRDEMRIG